VVGSLAFVFRLPPGPRRWKGERGSPTLANAHDVVLREWTRTYGRRQRAHRRFARATRSPSRLAQVVASDAGGRP
jgi:hypothetical protein